MKTRKGLILVVIVANILLISSPQAVMETGATVPGPVAYWPMDEGSGSTIEDSIGDHDGVINGAAWNDGELEFDGSADYVKVADDDELTFNGETGFSVSCQFKLDVIDKYHGLASKYSNSLNTKEFVIYIHPSEMLVVLIFDEDNDGSSADGSLYTYSSTDAVTTGTWYHLTVTYDGGTNETGINIYLDNTIDNDVQGKNNEFVQIQNTSADFLIGMSDIAQPAKSIDGKMKDIGIWNEELSAAEVEELYNNAQTTTTTLSTVNEFAFESPGFSIIIVLTVILGIASIQRDQK